MTSATPATADTCACLPPTRISADPEFPPAAQLYTFRLDNELSPWSSKHQVVSKLQCSGRSLAQREEVAAKERCTGNQPRPIQSRVCACDPGSGGARTACRRRRRTECGFLTSGESEEKQDHQNEAGMRNTTARRNLAKYCRTPSHRPREKGLHDLHR